MKVSTSILINLTAYTLDHLVAGNLITHIKQNIISTAVTTVSSSYNTVASTIHECKFN